MPAMTDRGGNQISASPQWLVLIHKFDISTATYAQTGCIVLVTGELYGLTEKLFNSPINSTASVGKLNLGTIGNQPS